MIFKALPSSSEDKHVPSISVRYLRVFGIRCLDLFRHADGVGTTLVHIPLVFDDSDHQVGSRRRDGIPAALDALGTHSRRMKALVAVLDEWDHFLTPSERGVRPCGNHSGPIRDRVPSDGVNSRPTGRVPPLGKPTARAVSGPAGHRARSLNHGPRVLTTGPLRPNRAVEVREPHLSGGRPLSRRAGSVGSGWLGSQSGRTPEEPHRR